MSKILIIIRYILLSVSIIFFLIALLIELCVFFPMPDLWDWKSPEGTVELILGFIILFLCTLILSIIRDRMDGKKKKETPPQPELDKKEKTPLRNIIGVILMFNAAFFFLTMLPGTPDFRDGQYVLSSRGKVIEVIDEETYYREINMSPTRDQKTFAAFFLMCSWIIVCRNLDE